MSKLSAAIMRAKKVLKNKTVSEGENTIIVTNTDSDHKDGALTIVLYEEK